MPLHLRIGAHIEPRDPFWVQVREAVYQRAQQLDAILVWLDADSTLLETYSAEAMAELRGQQLDALIAIYVAEPLAVALLAANIPLVHLSETAISAPHMVAPVGLYDSAHEAALFLAQHLGGRGDVLVVGGLCDAGEAGRSRLAAITHVAQAFPALVITHVPCLWSPQLAQPQLAVALQGRTRGFAGILGLSDSLAMLARDMAQAFGLVQVDTPIVGINGDPLALAAIAAGAMTATIETPAADFGFQAVDYACLLAQGETLPAPFGYQPELVTAQNVAAVAVRKLIAIAELPSRLVGVNREQEQRRLVQLEIGLEINRRVGGLTNRRQLSHLVADLIRTNYRYDSVQLLLWQPEQQLLLRDVPDALDTPQQIVLEGALATALHDNRTVFLPNVRRTLLDTFAPLVGSRVVVPIRLGETILGLLDMQNDTPIQLSQQDLAGLQSLADQLGVAMQNAELYEAALAAKAAAERADAIKTRLLANVSHELRTPVNVILGYSQSILLTSNTNGADLPHLLRDVQQIYQSGEHLIQLVNDLLDMSRADVGELDLFPEPIDTNPFLRAVFESMARSAPLEYDVAWELALPNDLPTVEADPIRLRQILLNLLQNAQCYTTQGRITLGAEATPTHLHLWVSDTGSGIPIELQDQIFEPFVRGDHATSVEGIGLGLSIARRLVALHGGALTLDSTLGQGSTFHVSLPWPPATVRESEPPRSLLLISTAGSTALALQDSLPAPVHVLTTEADLDPLLAQMQPSAVVFAPAEADEAAWQLLRHTRAHPLLAHVPLMLYEQPVTGQATTSVLLKPLREQTLQPLLAALQPMPDGSILIVDDDSAVREMFARLFRSAFPGFLVESAAGGTEALAYVRATSPSLVVLDLSMPDVDGFAVLEALRGAPETAAIPVLVLSGTQLGDAELRRLDQMHIVFQSKEILSDAEIAASARQLLAGDDRPAPQTSALVRQALAYIQRNYSRPMARSEIAAAIGVHKDYLSRIFQQELGISPWNYLLRYRVKQARTLLRTTTTPITEIAALVGFQDSAYFSRLFRKEVGCSPRMYREG